MVVLDKLCQEGQLFKLIKSANPERRNQCGERCTLVQVVPSGMERGGCRRLASPDVPQKCGTRFSNSHNAGMEHEATPLVQERRHHHAFDVHPQQFIIDPGFRTDYDLSAISYAETCNAGK